MTSLVPSETEYKPFSVRSNRTEPSIRLFTNVNKKKAATNPKREKYLLISASLFQV